MSWQRLVATALAGIGLGGCGSATATPSPPGADPIAVVEAWVAAREAGDIDTVMSLLAEEGDIFGTGIHLDDNRERLRRNFEGQAVAGWAIEETGCEADGERVTCRYRQEDEILRRWGLALTGEHRYAVRDGLIVRVQRIHDPQSANAVYAVTDAFRSWVTEHHPELVDVIWVDPTSALYTTPEGARAILELLDDFPAP
ncbi:MAG TPA: nuclear transport factor 2 family protein [Patescibacteria group bacterium]|nr:nuclear transport factor 2 family protein [Patescibacteria group bacterium]